MLHGCDKHWLFHVLRGFSFCGFQYYSTVLKYFVLKYIILNKGMANIVFFFFLPGSHIDLIMNVCYLPF